MLTIILTTFNRPLFLSRLLSYFRGYNVKHPIYVGDASEPAHLERNKETLSSVSEVLNIRHLVHDNSVDSPEIIFRCIEQAQTRYVVVVHDDDFLVPPTLDLAVEFMERNPSYESARGKQIAFTTASDGPYSTSMKMSLINKGDDVAVQGASAADRVRKRMSQNTLFPTPFTTFAVMRTPTAFRVYKEVLALGLDHPNTEGTLSHLLMLAGDSKLINRLYSARQAHGLATSRRSSGMYVPIITQSSTGESYETLVDMRKEEKLFQKPDVFDRLVDPLFPIKYERIATCLANELSRQDGISIEESRKIIKYWQWCFWRKRAWFEGSSGYQPYGINGRAKSVSKGLRRWVRQAPGLEQVRQKLRSISGGEVSPRALLHPNLSFYADFKPIYRAVTTPQADMDVNKDLVGESLKIGDRDD